MNQSADEFVLRKSKLFNLIILGFSFVGFILLIFTDIGGFWLTGPYAGERYSCLFCAYASFFERIAIILLIFLFLAQNAIGLNNYLSQKFYPKKFETLGMILAGSTIALTILAGISFAIENADYEWWFETAFYYGIVAGIVNFSMFFLLKTKDA
ncbi:MAG: hypothetical protein ACTSVZ_00770 [Promethearchaeota archaeon]